jgi:hypothetical protein
MTAQEISFAVTMGGQSVRVVSALAAVRGAVEDALTGAFAISTGEREVHWTLEVRQITGHWSAALERSSMAPRLVVEEGHAEDRVLCYSADRIVLARPESRHGGPYVLEVDHQARRWTLHIASGSLRDLRWVPRLVRLYFGALAQAEGCVFVHAAAVEWEGRGILFAGTGGSGKTSLAFLACSRLGARFLSDDVTVVRRRGDGTLSAFGWPRRVALGLSLLRHEPVFAEIQNRRLRRDGMDYSLPSADAVPADWARYNRVAFDPGEFLEIFGFVAGASARPALLVLPRADPDQEGWTVRRVDSAGEKTGLQRCGLEQLEYVTDFLGVTPHARPRTDAAGPSGLEELPAVAVSYGSVVMSDFGRFWEEVICRNLPAPDGV